MIVWVASFPRSGNTYLRILLKELYGIATSTVYEFDGVADRLGQDLVGFEETPETLDEMRQSPQPFFVKTHRPSHRDARSGDAAMCLVRDGRDALVSWARLRSEDDGRRYEAELKQLITEPEDRGAGGWGHNVLSWTAATNDRRHVLRYEDLIERPVEVTTAAVHALSLDVVRVPVADIPTFANLHVRDAGFFRRGVPGTHLEEMPPALADAFWLDPVNREAMTSLGYTKG